MAPTAKQNGMSFVGYGRGLYDRPSADESLRLLAGTGTNWISLIVTAQQADLASTSITFDADPTPTDAELLHVIDRAKGLRIKVMLKPHIDLPNANPWRGEIGTGFTTEQQWSAWFASYRDFIEHYAALAQAAGVEQLCVGTELVGTTSREADWRRIVAAVRARYGGSLVYAANWSLVYAANWGDEEAIHSPPV
jgi:hypothetical protein